MTLSTLNPREAQEMRDLHAQYTAVRGAKNFVLSDLLRRDLERRGCAPPGYDKWHPVSEAPDARSARAALRYMYHED